MPDWDILKNAITASLYGLVGFIFWFIRKGNEDTKHSIEELESRINKLEINIAVLDAQFKNIDKKLDEIYQSVQRILNKENGFPK